DATSPVEGEVEQAAHHGLGGDLAHQAAHLEGAEHPHRDSGVVSRLRGSLQLLIRKRGWAEPYGVVAQVDDGPEGSRRSSGQGDSAGRQVARLSVVQGEDQSVLAATAPTASEQRGEA